MAELADTDGLIVDLRDNRGGSPESVALLASGAHPARPYRLGEHFFAVIPGRRSISPVTHTNLEGVGVIPDIAMKPDNALAAAKDLLQRRLQGTAPLVAAGH